MPRSQELKIPYRITGPAIVKILQPMPKICPSAWNSIAEEATEFAKPVIGTSPPASQNFPIVKYRFSQVKSTLRKIKISEHQFPAVSLSAPMV